MTVDNNKTLLTKVSACFIIIEVYSMRKISVNLFVSLMYGVFLIWQRRNE